MKDINAKTVLDEETNQFYYEGLADFTKYKESNVAHYLDELSRPNLLINGDFQVWQRGDSAFMTNKEGNKPFVYGPDRFLLENTRSDVNAVVNHITKDDGQGVGLRATVGGVICKYLMELKDYKKIQGKTVTLSYSINNVIKTHTNQAPNLDENAEYGIGFELTLPYNEVLNWVRLEMGSFATPFYPRCYAEELLLCQRYYQRTEQFTSLCISNAQLSKSYTGTTFLVKMRTLPEITNINIITSNNVDISNMYHTARWGVNGISYIDLKERKGDCIHVNYVWLDAEIY